MPNNSDEDSNSTETKAVAGRVGHNSTEMKAVAGRVRHNSKEAKAANRQEETET